MTREEAETGGMAPGRWPPRLSPQQLQKQSSPLQNIPPGFSRCWLFRLWVWHPVWHFLRLGPGHVPQMSFPRVCQTGVAPRSGLRRTQFLTDLPSSSPRMPSDKLEAINELIRFDHVCTKDLVLEIPSEIESQGSVVVKTEEAPFTSEKDPPEFTVSVKEALVEDDFIPELDISDPLSVSHCLKPSSCLLRLVVTAAMRVPLLPWVTGPLWPFLGGPFCRWNSFPGWLVSKEWSNIDVLFLTIIQPGGQHGGLCSIQKAKAEGVWSYIIPQKYWFKTHRSPQVLSFNIQRFRVCRYITIIRITASEGVPLP